MNKNNNTNNGSFMSFSNDCQFLDELEDKKNLNFESLESENFIEPISFKVTTESNKIEFFSEISPIAHIPNNKNCNIQKAKYHKNFDDKKFLTADSQYSCLVNIGNKNHFSLDCKSTEAENKSVFTFNDRKSELLASKGKSLILGNSIKNQNEFFKPKQNIMKKLLDSKTNSTGRNKRSKAEERKDKFEENFIERENKNERRNCKKANNKEKHRDKDDNKKLYLENILKNKEQNIAKFAIDSEKEEANRFQKAKVELFKPTCETANIQSIKNAQVSISDSTEDDISFAKFLNLLQKGMYSCGFFSSDVCFEDFKRELEKLNISLKSAKFNLTDKLHEFKEKLQSFSKEKKENLFFYYYVSINLMLQSLVKAKINLRINKKFELDTIQSSNLAFIENISINNNKSHEESIRSPSSTKNPSTMEYIKSITIKKESKNKENCENSTSSKAEKRDNDPSKRSPSPLIKTEENPITANQIISNPQGNFYLFKPFNEHNHFDIQNKIIQAQNNLVFMPYSKNIANSFSVSNFTNRNNAMMHQMAENFRYSIPPKPQMMINRNPIYSQTAFDNKNKKSILPSNQQHTINFITPQNNLLPIANQRFDNQMTFNPMIPMMNRCYSDYINIQRQLAMNNHINLKQQKNIQAQNPSAVVSNNNPPVAKDILENKSELQKTPPINPPNTINSRPREFEIPKIMEPLGKTNDKKQNFKNQSKYKFNNSDADSIAMFNEPYSYKERSNSKDGFKKKIEFSNSESEKKSNKNFKQNNRLSDKFDIENKENYSKQGNKLLGLKRNQTFESEKDRNSNNSKERNLKKIKHS